MQTDISIKKYLSVSDSSTENYDYVIPNGKRLIIDEAGGNSSPSEINIHFEIIWDPSGTNELILSSYGDTTQKRNDEYVGDGIKFIRIKLINTSNTSRYMGAYLLGRLIDV